MGCSRRPLAVRATHATPANHVEGAAAHRRDHWPRRTTTTTIVPGTLGKQYDGGDGNGDDVRRREQWTIAVAVEFEGPPAAAAGGRRQREVVVVVVVVVVEIV